MRESGVDARDNTYREDTGTVITDSCTRSSRVVDDTSAVYQLKSICRKLKGLLLSKPLEKVRSTLLQVFSHQHYIFMILL